MDIYIKSIASPGENPATFLLSANTGTITPSLISYNELISGAIVSFSDNTASQITFSAQGFQPKTVIINKNRRSCFQKFAANYIEGNTRPTNADGTNAPFRTATIAPSSLEYLFNLNVGEKFTLQIFDESIEFTIYSIDAYSTNEVKIEASKQVGEIYSFLQLFKNSETGEIYFFYKDVLNSGLIHYSSKTSQIDEWTPKENFTTCHAQSA